MANKRDLLTKGVFVIMERDRVRVVVAKKRDWLTKGVG